MSRRDVETRLVLTGGAQYERGMGSAAKSADGLGKTVDDMVEGFSLVGVAVAAAAIPLAAFARITETSVRAFGALAVRGGPVDAITSQFERMASPELLGRLQEFSGHQVRQTTVMQSWTAAMQGGLVTGGEYERWLTQITDIAQARGQDPAALLERMRDVLAGGELAGLRELGISAEDLGAKLQAMGLSAETAEGQATALDIALAQLEAQSGESTTAATTLAEAWREAQVAAEDFLDVVARTVSTSPALIAAANDLNEALRGVGGAAEFSGRVVAILARNAVSNISAAAGAVAGIVLELMEGMQRLANSPTLRAILTAGQAMPMIMPGASAALAGLERIREQAGLEDLRQTLIGIRALATDVITDVHLLPLTGAGRETPARQATPAGPDRQATPAGPDRRARGAGGRQAADAARDQATERALAEKESLEAGAAAYEAAMAERQQQIAGITTAAIEAVEAQTAAEQQARQDAIEGAKEKHRVEMDMMAERKQASRALLTESFGAAEGFASEMSGIFGQIADNLEKQGKSASAWRKAQGITMGIYYAIKAIGETAEAVASFASQNYAAGALHVAAAASHTVASVMSFVQLAQTGAASAPATAKPAQMSAKFQKFPETKAVGGGGPVTVNNYLMGRSGADIGDRLSRAMWEGERSGRVKRNYGIRYGAAA